MANTKLSAFLSLLLVFCSGIVVGGVGYRVYNTSVAASVKPLEKRPSPEELRNRLVDEMTREVHLDDQQVTLLKQIYEQTRVRFDEVKTKLDAAGQSIHDDQVDKIKKMLRQDQIPLYDSLRARHEAERAAREAADRKKGGGRHKGGPGDK
jgi:hypothetical protein